MAKRSIITLAFAAIFLAIAIFLATFSNPPPASSESDDFLQCLYLQSPNTSFSNIVFTPTNHAYLSVLETPIKNLRFTLPSTPRPLVIVTPEHEDQIQVAVRCAKENGLQIRTRSGGHDYEGLSHKSDVPFVIVDLVNMREITIDVDKQTAWVQSGANLGLLYYSISQASKTLAFPAGVCPTVGVGGHFSGGGYGTLLRKYGLAADNVIDAHFIDANGRILDRSSMGEDVFWAIRGGGGGSFGIISTWKIKLVPIPETVTIFSVNRNLEQNMTNIFHRWQYVIPDLPQELFIASLISKVNASNIPRKYTVQSTFISLYLGGVDQLLEIMQKIFPELGLTRQDCTEVRWIQSVLLFGNYSIDTPPEVLTSRVALDENLYLKAKSDYLQVPITENGLEGIWELFSAEEANLASLSISAYGGRNNEISEVALPFPHRDGNLFIFLNRVYWSESGEEASDSHINWMRSLYDYLEAYVSKTPRAHYTNYRDLDLGVNNDQGNTTYEQASIWGFHYFKNNFNRLARVKSVIDPTNFFRHEQSIPLIHSWTS